MTAGVRRSSSVSAKEYGTGRLVQGAEVISRCVVLVEGVITTGGAARDAVGALLALGATVELVVCAIDRSGAGWRCADVDLEVRSVLTLADLDAAHSTH